ncbi:sulfatase-like hydrolase/transferase [Myxococcota bacterium]|nr:sulfatase-like hydrolase/transferase [Myxococcota bacterium]
MGAVAWGDGSDGGNDFDAAAMNSGGTRPRRWLEERRGSAALRVLLCLLFGGFGLGCTPARSGPPDIVLVVIDTLRSDRVSAYGYARETTPRLDALAQRGIRFDRASSTSSWTVPAHASLFTGLAPLQHGAHQEHARLEPGIPTLAERLRDAGYATFGASANPLVGSRTGLSRGFDAFAETWRPAAREGRTHPNQDAVLSFLGDVPVSQPVFLFLNYMEVHGPYDPPLPFRAEFLSAAEADGTFRDDFEASRYYLDRNSISDADFRRLSDLYDGEVAYADALLGELLDALDRADRLDNAVLVVTSDHGENLGDHGHFRHVFNLYGSTVSVPLVFVLPDDSRAGEVVEAPVSLVDVFASILAAAGLPPGGVGRDLLGSPVDPGRAVYAEYFRPAQALTLFTPGEFEEHSDRLRPFLRVLRSVEHGGLRLIWSSDGKRELYDVKADPGEQRNLWEEPAYAQRAMDLVELLEGQGGRPGEASEQGLLDGVSASPFGVLDAEEEARLRELGYLRP